LLITAASLAALSRVPVHGSYLWDLFPAFVIAGFGLSLCFVPMTIAGLSGVGAADAGVASGLINTSRQIGGAVGLAVISTVATTFTNQYVESHAGASASTDAALTQGFERSFYVLTALALVGALIAATLIRPRPRASEIEPTESLTPLEEAA
jgi:sugar phosphate permease